jgi:predicted  nucleic acid-binding Zn-ribbon protein
MSDLAEDFMAPIRAREQKLSELDVAITNKSKELAALEGECNVARQAMNDLGSQRVELQNAVNANRALLSKSQSDLASVQAMYEALRRKVQSLPITTRAAS